MTNIDLATDNQRRREPNKYNKFSEDNPEKLVGGDSLKYSDESERDQGSPDIPKVIMNPKRTPITGGGHILLEYDPHMAEVDYIRMNDMKFYKGDKKLHINKEHYQPTFIASGVDELREQKNTRKILKKFRIFEQCPDDDEEYAAEQKAMSYQEDDTGQEKSKQRLKSASNKSQKSSSIMN